MAPIKKEALGVITLSRLKDDELTVPIVGVTPLIPHNWSEKARLLMRQVQAQGTRAKKEPKDAEAEAEASLYHIDDKRIGMPAVAFKATIVAGCRFFDKPSMTEAKVMFFVVGEGPDQLIPIEGDRTLREDMPRNANGGTDLRYRYAIWPWKATITVRFPAGRVTPETVLALLDAGGRVGVGDWRPGAPKSLTGTFGQFRVAD